MGLNLIEKLTSIYDLLDQIEYLDIVCGYYKNTNLGLPR